MSGTWEAAVRSLIDDPAQRMLVEACYFDLPLTAAAARYAADAEWTALRDIIGAPRGVAVDIGAGNGIVSYALAKDGWRTVAVEPDPSALVGAAAIRALAQATDLAIEVREGVGEALPVATGEAALVIARQVLHHASDLPAFAREIARGLAPGGQLVSLRDHVISGDEQLQPFLDKHPLHRFYGGENAFTRAAYRAALEQAGLVIERELGPFDSAINYAPHTTETLRQEIAARLGPAAPVARGLLAMPGVMGGALRLLSAIDRRPGRLVSFVCRKPG
jgi:SAM-dependent methyltransferase